MPTISEVVVGFIAVMWLASIVAAAIGGFSGLVRGHMYWPDRNHAPKRLSGASARVGGVLMLILAVGLCIPLIRVFQR